MVRARGNSRLLPFLLLTMGLSACTGEFDRRYAEAESLRVEAAALGWEWIDTGNLLEQAREVAAKGDEEKALELVEKARFQAEAAIKQAEHEAEAWKGRVVR
jgi:hypothetical protein